jgi:hypothetical protein
MASKYFKNKANYLLKKKNWEEELASSMNGILRNFGRMGE